MMKPGVGVSCTKCGASLTFGSAPFTTCAFCGTENRRPVGLATEIRAAVRQEIAAERASALPPYGAPNTGSYPAHAAPPAATPRPMSILPFMVLPVVLTAASGVYSAISRSAATQAADPWKSASTSAPAPVPAAVEPPRPTTGTANEGWGATKIAGLGERLSKCGQEALATAPKMPRVYRLVAPFDRDGGGLAGAKITSTTPGAPPASLEACVAQQVRFYSLGKPPENRDFSVTTTLDFSQLTPPRK